MLQEDTCALLWSAYSISPTSVYQKNIHKRKPTICKAEIWNPSLMMAFIIFPTKPEETQKRQYSILKAEFTTGRYLCQYATYFQTKKNGVALVRQSREQSWVHILYVLSKVTCWWFQTTKFHSDVEKNLYQKKVITEAFAFLKSPAKHPFAARSRFILLMKFHWQYWCLNSNPFRAHDAYFLFFIQCSPEWGSYFKLETMQVDNKYYQ